MTDSLTAVRGAIARQLRDIAATPKGEAIAGLLPALLTPEEAAVPWTSLLLLDGNGKVAGIMDNVALILGNHAQLKGVLAKCDFSHQIKKVKAADLGIAGRLEVGALDDDDAITIKRFVTQHYRVSPNTREVEEAIKSIAKQASSHPIRDYLNSLRWDGEERLGRFLSDVFESEQDPEYLRLAGRKFLIASVARIFKPGCKMDNMLILEGKQGKRKSSFVEMMYSPWSISSTFDIRSKDGFQFIQGLWAVEFAELDAMNRAESTAAKQFITSPVDRFRPPFGRLTQDYPRQCVFLGTTNDKQYLSDPTGNRRYWPVECPVVNFEYAQGIRDQIWAEALHCFREGEEWWVRPHEAPLFEYEQDRKTVDDLWQAPIEEWVNDAWQSLKDEFTGAQILHGALKKDIGHGSKVDYKRIGDVMKGMGWEKRKKRIGVSVNPVWVYMRPQKADDPAAKNEGLNALPSASGQLSDGDFQNWEEER